ncbi:snaclec coagulation factor IX/factor X-binding protein subunit B-like [Branchiostoma floridae x Branchiostoma japonicum]
MANKQSMLDLDKERNRTAALEQRLHKISKTPACTKGYTVFRGFCYKAFKILKTFNDAAATCGEDSGTLAMPRDAEINDFLVSLYNYVPYSLYWIGLHRHRKKGSFEWVDGSALGDFNSWGPRQPRGVGECVGYYLNVKGKWKSLPCDYSFHFICQVAPGF